MDESLQLLQWALQALAQPAEVQMTLFPDFVSKADELAVDFHHWLLYAEEEHLADFTANQKGALLRIDEFLNVMGGARNAKHWTDDALHHDPMWKEVRGMAKEALDEFGWPNEKPPMDRGGYQPGL